MSNTALMACRVRTRRYLLARPATSWRTLTFQWVIARPGSGAGIGITERLVNSGLVGALLLRRRGFGGRFVRPGLLAAILANLPGRCRWAETSGFIGPQLTFQTRGPARWFWLAGGFWLTGGFRPSGGPCRGRITR